MRVLITGGAGFIGSHLAEAYLARKDNVHVLDDLTTGSAANISHLRKNSFFECTFKSVHDEHVVAELVDWSDLVIHLAAVVGVLRVVESPLRAIQVNLRGTEVVLSCAAKKRKRVLIASTSEVYGSECPESHREDAPLSIGHTAAGRWSYACCKAMDEFMGLAYFRELHVPVIIVRLFNTVGPRQSGQYGMVLPTFVRQALAGEPLTVHDNGEQRRCFCHVKDTVRALMALCDSSSAIGEVINVGSNEEASVLQLADLVRMLSGSNSELMYVPYKQAFGIGFEDVKRRVPNLDKIRRLIQWHPQYRLHDTVKSVIEHTRGGKMNVEPGCHAGLV